jgi:arylformamidase
MVATMMATDWPRFGGGMPAGLVAGGCGISGLCDLEPIRLSYLNEVVKLDTADVARNSPILVPPRGREPLIVAVGETESEEYHRQADDYLAAVVAADGNGEKYVAPNLNHYSIIDEFLRPESLLAQATAQKMGLWGAQFRSCGCTC